MNICYTRVILLSFAENYTTMGLNYKKLEEAQVRFEDDAKKESFQNLAVGIINLLNSPTLNHILCEVKYSKSDDIPARILNNWISEGVVAIDEADTIIAGNK
jgi:hypothetical protein